MRIDNDNNFRKLMDLIVENPYCSIYPIVSQSVCSIDKFYDTDFSVCEFGEPYLKKYCYYSMGSDYELSLYTEDNYDEVTADMNRKGVTEVEWITGIFVPIIPPNDMP